MTIEFLLEIEELIFKVLELSITHFLESPGQVEQSQGHKNNQGNCNF
jgi:hypothetical protein